MGWYRAAVVSGWVVQIPIKARKRYLWRSPEMSRPDGGYHVLAERLGRTPDGEEVARHKLDTAVECLRSVTTLLVHEGYPKLAGELCQASAIVLGVSGRLSDTHLHCLKEPHNG